VARCRHRGRQCGRYGEARAGPGLRDLTGRMDGSRTQARSSPRTASGPSEEHAMRKAQHDANVTSYEQVRQTSKAADNTAAGHKAADVAYYKSVLASGQTNKVQTNAMQALINLGVTLPALSSDTI